MPGSSTCQTPAARYGLSSLPLPFRVDPRHAALSLREQAQLAASGYPFGGGRLSGLEMPRDDTCRRLVVQVRLAIDLRHLREVLGSIHRRTAWLLRFPCLHLASGPGRFVPLRIARVGE